MKRSEITPQLQDAAFDFFFWFSRFESCLKQHAYLKSDDPGKKAEPNWDKFVKRNRNTYVPSPSARALISARPKQQIVAASPGLGWKELQFEANEYDLQKVTLLLRLVRNNLFHGGRHGERDWENEERTLPLLAHCQAVLEELAELGKFSADYRGAY